MLVVQVIIVVLLSALNLDWNYECALGRLGIYITGIVCFLDDKNRVYKKTTTIYLLLLPAVLALYMGGYLHTYMIMYFLAPLVIIGICAIFSMFNKERRMVQLINLVGGVTLEIYVANCICMKLQRTYEGLNGEYIYWALNLLIAPMIIILNKYIIRAIEAHMSIRK